MDALKKMPRQYLIFGGIVLVLVLIIVGLMISKNNKAANSTEEKKKPFQEQLTEVIPTVGPEVKVDLEFVDGNREIMITVDGVPEGTESIDYELSYDTEAQGLQGVIGTIEVEEGEDSVSKQFTAGTCSSGRCVVHKIVGSITTSLKFTGSYGEQVFEKDFEL